MGDVIVAGGTEYVTYSMGVGVLFELEIAQEHPEYYLGMGLTAEEVAKDTIVSREDMDAFSLRIASEGSGHQRRKV